MCMELPTTNEEYPQCPICDRENDGEDTTIKTRAERLSEMTIYHCETCGSQWREDDEF